MEITTAELTQCKRAVVALAEILKTLTDGKKPPLALRQDMLVLTQILRRLEPIATQPMTRRHRLIAGDCASCDAADLHVRPPHDASPRCESGKHNHCSCDVCF